MASIPQDKVSRQTSPDLAGVDPLDLAVAAVRTLCHGLPMNADYCTSQYLGAYEPLITAMRQELDRVRGEEVAVIVSMMTDLWHAQRDDPRYAALRDRVDLLDSDDTAELGAGATGHGHDTPPPLCPPLPTHPEEDANLIACLAAEASPWLDEAWS